MKKRWVFLGVATAVASVAALLLRRPLVVALEGSGMDPSIPAEYRMPPSIDPELAEHTRLYDRKIHDVGQGVHVAVGYGLANIILVEGTDGVVIVDTGETLEQAEAVRAEFLEITDKPVRAVILTHHHADHVLGTSAFVTPDDAASGKVPIIAHESLVKHYVDETGIIAEVQAVRSAHMYGSTLGPADRKDGNNGIGPYLGRGPGGFLPPNKTFTDALDLTIAGVRMQMRWVPSEAESEIAIYLPEKKVLLSAEVVQDHTFPNVYTIRGARYRDPIKWVRSLDLLREWHAETMVLQHGPPVHGAAEVEHVLTVYRDEIQFVHDQTIRYMNKGLTGEEIANVVKLPPHLDAEHPWGRQYYGTVKHSVRNVYGGYLGWFQGDPVDLDPTPRPEYARRVVALMGGRDKVLEAGKRAWAARDDHFAAELATLLVRIDSKDMDARHLKAAAFRRLGYAEVNANWRNYYLVSAMELDDQVPEKIYTYEASKMLGTAMKGLPAESQIDALPSRLRAEDALDDDLVGGIRYEGIAAPFRLHLRRGVLEVSRKAVTDAAFVLAVTRESMGAFLGGAPFESAFDRSPGKLEGDAGKAAQLFSRFETPFQRKPEVVVR
jgi:alkyl sulfatase BDS1-like metallo-beta-lactamase superfamily hydrolase